jgi:putative ribosome biogenesis GTPase RsgA
MCRYRDCLHRTGEEGCVAPDQIDPETLEAYRELVGEASEVARRRGPG